MTLEEFRNHKFLPNEWAKLLRESGILRRVLQTMEENHPAHFTLTGDNGGDVSPTRASIELGVTRGYSMYGDRLLSLARQTKAMKQIGEPTYEKEASNTEEAQRQG